jgi:hypothetical protein
LENSHSSLLEMSLAILIVRSASFPISKESKESNEFNVSVLRDESDRGMLESK